MCPALMSFFRQTEYKYGAPEQYRRACVWLLWEKEHLHLAIAMVANRSVI